MKEKKFTIYRTEPEGADTFQGEETTKREAVNKAKRVFSNRPSFPSEVFVEEQKEILRLLPRPIGFREKK